MLKIQVITPVYIGSGKKICVIKKGQFIYSVDEIIKEKINNTKNNDLLKIKKSCWNLARSNNPSKEDYFRAFNIDERLISNSSIISNDPLYAKNVSSNYGDLFLFQKSLGKMIIPGSTIKGIINNIFWYYIINKRKEIKEYFINNISSTNKILDELDGSIRNIKYFLKISDIVLDCGAKVVTIKNYGLKKGNREIGNHETIFCNESIQTSAIGEIPEFEIKMLKEVKKEIEKKGLTREKQIVLNEYCEYILQLKKIFPQVNKEYMLEVVKKENEFVKDSCNENFDHNGLKHFYADILKKLNENRIIMQVGGRTVFYDKTFMFALGKDYEENFSKYFNSRKNKNEPIVQSMNLTKIDNSYYPLGFIEIEL